MMASLFPDAKIFCFEPLPDPFRQLNTWAMSQRGNVKAFNLALGDSEGDIEIYCHVDHPPSSSLLMTTESITTVYPFVRRQVPVPVRLATLDKLLADSPEFLSPEIIIKLDVQGYEDRVARGGVDTFRKARACILEINMDNLYCGQADFRNLVNQLYELGFRYGGNLEQSYAGDGHVVYVNTVFVKKEAQGGI
jgi:FkbM family methyltransferase